MQLPALPANATPGVISLSSSSGGAAVLEDVLIGDVHICSGQSNMGIPVSWAVDYAAVLARAGALGPTLRLLQVALLDSYTNATTPQDNFTASVPWSRASASSAAPFSALCFFIGERAVNAHPAIPIGMIANPWGGVAIQVYMSPAALAQCGAADAAPPPAVVAAAERAVAAQLGASASPTINSCLYNSMMHPLLSVPVSSFIWLQGESNSQDPLGYQCLQRAMITDYRQSWNAVGAPTVAFLFVQLACWPTGASTDYLSIFRASQALMVAQAPRSGMIVTSDICDNAGAFHPMCVLVERLAGSFCHTGVVRACTPLPPRLAHAPPSHTHPHTCSHPAWKYEAARRAWLWLDAEVYGNASSPKAGPAVTAARWDYWQASWGDYHLGTGLGSALQGPRAAHQTIQLINGGRHWRLGTGRLASTCSPLLALA